jgi:hypothetical protein
VFNGYGILALFPKHQKIIRRSYATARGIFHDGLMGEVFCHRSVANSERFFPDTVPSDVLPSLAFVEPDDVTGKVRQVVSPTIARRHVHTVNASHAPGHRQPEEVPHDESVMLKKLLVVLAIR